MFLGSKKRHNRADGVSHPSNALRNEAEKLKSRQWHAWRRSAQTVTRVWHEWLAANGPERTELFRR